MKAKSTFYLLSITLLTLLLSGCAALERLSPAPTATAEKTGAVFPTPLTEPLMGLATVESVEIQTLESFPVQINVRFTGVLPNACTTIDDMVAAQEGSTFNVAVTTLQEPGESCPAGEVPFEEILPLDVNGLDAGSYAVSVNGVQGSFNLDVDNKLEEETAAPTPVPTATSEPATDTPASYTINGRVWHDLCQNGTAADNETPVGCITTADGELVADGLLENEPGIAGVRVTLGQGACPAAEGILTATTDAAGSFSFGNLTAAEYCVSVDTSNEQNQDILLPGSWTAPAAEVAEAALIVGDEETVQEVDFGWDYELLPVDPATCSNSFEFVEDLNIPDDTVFAPGEEFTKEWRLRNNGTCAWSTEYAVVFVGGEQMSAEEQIPLTQSTAVSQTLDVAVTMIAPDDPGSYRGNWQLAAPDGEPFGIDGNIEDAFWLRIVVEEESTPSATPLPDSGAIGGVVWDDFCLNSSPARGCIESAANSGVFIADGSFDAFESSLSEITITLAENACPGNGTLPSASAIIDTAVTGTDGLYLFDGLSDGTYCIFMDALSPENVDALIPGNWTWPGTGVGQYTFVLDPGEQALDLDFGWDYVD